MTAGQICSRVVATATPDEAVRVAAQRMAQHDLGTLVVVSRSDPAQPVGIVTDRDLAMRCVAGTIDPDDAQVSQVMTQPADTIDEFATIDAALTRMADRGIRRLIVTGDGHALVGLLSLDDVLDLLGHELRPITRLLDKQQPHIPA
jgi:signal-transduction protein with cAMP-binding, CBS, and nucleotidyltransferase domain